MGTRSLTVFLDEYKNEEIAVMYRHFDGYPTGHGKALAEFLHQFRKDGEKNHAGMACLACQIIQHFKDGECNFYLYPAGVRGIGEEYTYTIQLKEKQLNIELFDHYCTSDGKVVFDGTPEKLINAINQKGDAL